MANLNSVNWNRLERELLNSFSAGRVPNSFEYDRLLRRICSGEHRLFYNGGVSRFRKVWIGFTRLNSICITAFDSNPHQGYRMFFGFKVQEFTLESMRRIVLSRN